MGDAFAISLVFAFVRHRLGACDRSSIFRISLVYMLCVFLVRAHSDVNTYTAKSFALAISLVFAVLGHQLALASGLRHFTLVFFDA